ncbi:tRNA (adenosine(37)-N6)-dimethylallyltransferase MiaA [Methylobacterium organophilum]|uniref:tRNA dimethylallyltransferase n=1 Tax=Methylobacterium organophilum TaxID=410 RepID=A0ABQ4TDH4_METOR|nr:tRNA (adenosine(37)-N6)-dimethylallyltransferase MiaA [Methylobacterium organophilum]UMY17538.1 tRNA (adenosine(37)-N6)-dimethylallyltransferase MiaA [Methylobacterium organophilum]GJE29731.1 tRNA dimethylallyltransferase [Methylobacterium organophilum]
MPLADRSGAGRERPAAVLIAGPTASGKSALALALAQRFHGSLINTDSMQVYADLRRLSARPSVDEEALAPHRLYGSVDGAVNFSVGHFQRAAAALLEETGRAGRLPIFVGGTGLYFRALEEGFSDMPEVPDAVRAAVRAEAEGRPTEALHAELAALDPEGAASLRPSDRMRVMRALEIFRATGRPIAAFQGRRAPGPLAGQPLLRIFLDVEREALRARIDARFLAMMAAGALDEVAALRARRLDPMLPVMRAHGVPGLIAHLDGALPYAEAVRRGQADTRRYAKRQFTWFRHQMGEDWIWTRPEAALALASEALTAPAAR